MAIVSPLPSGARLLIPYAARTWAGVYATVPCGAFRPATLVMALPLSVRVSTTSAALSWAFPLSTSWAAGA